MTATLLTTLPEWKALQIHHQAIREQKMRVWFAEDSDRFAHFSVREGEIILDYSKNRITRETLDLLKKLALSVHLPAKIQALFAAEPLNSTESRPALHTALRHKGPAPIWVQNQDVVPLVRAALEKMRHLVMQVHTGARRGVTGKTITDVVNIGIGGSHLGPLVATHALASHAITALRFHFISDVDHIALQEVLQQIDAERTLFIVSSKSFTTMETIANANSCSAWLQQQLNLPKEKITAAHFIAVTAQKIKAQQWGIKDENIFPIWDWVGGRYSVWSAIGLPLALQIGMDGFENFLEGAYQADQHFLSNDLLNNIPVLMGLLSIWYINFFDASTHAIIPYAHSLKHLRAYLQQLDMESNGKRRTHAGIETSYATGPIIWGELGIHGQHAFHQLLHQGTHFAPVDFLLVGSTHAEQQKHHDLLIANALSQARALMHGNEELTADEYLSKHQEIPGNRPSNILFMDKLTPLNLGSLLAYYEHKIFVQSVIWDVNPFDQWGVELGKTLLPTVLENIHQDEMRHQYDSSTENLILHYKNLRKK